MTRPRTIVACIGTRPEAIKMAPVIGRLKTCGWAHTVTVATGQHRQLLDQVLRAFDLRMDLDLDLMREGQSPGRLAARVLEGLDEVLGRLKPDFLLAQGDTTTLLATAIAGYYRRVPFGHVEAGLRTSDLDAPFPEEGNRVVATRLASLHFAPTEQARENLLRENVPPQRIRVVGNTVVDALVGVRRLAAGLEPEVTAGRRLVVVTVHRRESFGAPLRRICRGVRALVDRCSEVEVLWPLHPNPEVSTLVREQMTGAPRVRLVESLPYPEFVAAMSRAYLLLTDSGGVQEEAPVLGVPVLVLRDKTERPEAIQAGVARLVGTESEEIERRAAELLNEPSRHRKMAVRCSPFGDGQAARRIVAWLEEALDPDREPER